MDAAVLNQEQDHLNSVRDNISTYRKDREAALTSLGQQNLERLKELRADPETGPDFEYFLEQLNEKNVAFDIKGKFKRLEELDFLIKEPFFARIDLKDLKASDQQIYIGKFGFSVENNSVVTDWRAPIASIYYRYRYPQKNVAYVTPSETVTTDLALKRTFEIYEGKLLKYYNNDIQFDESQIIVEKIKKRTGGVLEDIIETIQKDQIDIIEADPRQVCIVQGCVGSGKSTVAIHKLAHIFFNFERFIHPEKSILIAKNQILVGYLSTLFPKLGIFDIKYKTLRELAVNLIFREEISIKFDFDLVEKSVTNIKTFNTFQKEILKIHTKVKKEIEKIFTNPNFSKFGGYKYSTDSTCIENVNEIFDDLNEELQTQSESLKENPKSIRALFIKENIKSLRQVLKYLTNLKQKIRNEFFNLILKSQKIDTFQTLTYSHTLSYLYLYSRIIGYSKFQPYEYCVVDEGQDFSAVEYAVLNSCVLRGRFGIFGDLNQSIETDCVLNWNEITQVIEEAKKANVFELTTNYRSTKQIIEVANKIISKFSDKYLPKSINRQGKEPLIETFKNADEMFESFIKQILPELKTIDKSIAIICYDQNILHKVDEFLTKNVDNNSLIKLDSTKKVSYLPKGIYYMNSHDCKGLEFSKVFILGLNPKNIKNEKQAKLAFVCVTRAMNDLHIMGIL